MPINRWIDKEDVAHIYTHIPCIYNGLLLSHKKEWNHAICSNIDGPRDYHTKWSKSDKRKTDIWYHLCMKSKIRYKWTYVQNKNRLTDIEYKFMAIKGESGEGIN